ncbi:Hypothetical protein R9X50_00721600 [Acrodontium crateriforme]|uniref:Velvet domain-containing protein n=1 Tax=Acrodontium crateriforme TaxID=150365 RepID=A0AAQ3MB59_9PEZI|nr:Hypothetical protein R9X50_00721600 [Acrodontium crateriforme]
MEKIPVCHPVENESNGVATRVTIGGRELTYCLKIIQQPQRARACGSGAKSSADRRPVDPPPIIELKIYDGPGETAENDITFHMQASYLLFATLEIARPIAPTLAEEKTQPPCMTGSTVAGMVHLDRPTPAGYFVFPDLSVRHEGLYRLSFALYEELKNPNDADKPHDLSRGPVPIDGHVTHRLEVKTTPFHVFSAKKFPGLTESTALSRTVAEQGCRVRIRRDVRLRRRGEEKPGYEDSSATQVRARESMSPDPSRYPHHSSDHSYSSSISNARSGSIAKPAPMDIQPRRPSHQEMNQRYQPYTPASSHHSSFSQSSHNGQSYGPPDSSFAPAPPQLPQPVMQPASTSYSSQRYQQSSIPSASPSNPQGSYYSYGPASQSPIAPSQPSYDTDSRRGSLSAPAPAPPSSMAPSYSFSHQQAHASTSPSTYHLPPSPRAPLYPASSTSYIPQETYAARRLPPQPVQPPTQTTGARPAIMLPPLQTTGASSRFDPPSGTSPIFSIPQSSYYSSNKRDHSAAFGDRHLAQPLRDGARPSLTYDGPTVEPETTGDFIPSMVHYRRADGRPVMRSLPQRA